MAWGQGTWLRRDGLTIGELIVRPGQVGPLNPSEGRKGRGGLPPVPIWFVPLLLLVAAVPQDTYHMHIEESGFEAAVRLCGSKLGYVHIGESHRCD